MKKRLALCALALLAAWSFAAQAQTGRWTYYPSYHNVQATLVADDLVYSLSNGALAAYDPETSEVRTYNKATGLSDADIALMAYAPAQSCLVLVYANANIDVVYPSRETLVNMPQFMNSSLADHTINDLTVNGRYAYLAEASGVSVVDLQKSEFSNTYTLGRRVNSALCSAGTLYAFTPDGVYAGSLTANLLDPSNWQQISATAYEQARLVGGNILARNSAGLWNLGSDATAATQIHEGALTWMNATTTSLLCGSGDVVLAVDGTGAATTLLSGTNNIGSLARLGSTYWGACGNEGLVPFALTSGSLAQAGTAVIIDSPIYNYCDKMNIGPSGNLWVAGGSMNYQGLNFPATLYRYDWSHFVNYPDTLQKITGLGNYRNVTGVAEDPTDPTHVFATTAETGLYEFRGDRFVAHYDYEENGGHLYSAAPGYGAASRDYVRTGAPAFDADGNLWVANFEVDTVVQVLKKNGSWKGFYIEQLENWPTFDHIMHDGAGRAWITHRRTTSSHHAAIVCLDYGGTLDDESDDRALVRYDFVNQDGESVRPDLVSSVCMDREGMIWVGTSEGPYVIEQPDEFFESSFTFSQIKIPRNDGTDYADYLLDGIAVSDIAIDQAGRKWIGTSSNGLYFISADNMTQLAHFTTDNSPLPSNQILSLAVNDDKNLVMIGTAAGLMSYRFDAAVSDDALRDSGLKVYPNPVRPDYVGSITVSGLSEGADVKIVSTSGMVVAHGRSAGGSFSWNGCDSRGGRVSTGVYYVLATTQNGSRSAGTKIVFIR